MGEKVKFFNARISGRGGGRLPHLHSSIRTPMGVVDLGKIELYDLTGKKRTQFIDGREAPVYWEGMPGTDPKRPGIYLNAQTVSVEFDSVMHKDLIKAIREWPGCKSSKKSDEAKEFALKHKITHYLIEDEPDVVEAEEYKGLERQLLATNLLAKVKKQIESDELEGHLVAALAGMTYGTASGKVLFMRRFSEENRDQLISFFIGEEFDQKRFNEALIAIAMGEGVIQARSGVLWFGEQELGSQSKEIPAKYPNALASIREKVEEKLGISNTKKKATKKAAE